VETLRVVPCKLTIDVVSDVVCPWCFIGKRHLDRALELWREEQPDCEVTVQLAALLPQSGHARGAASPTGPSWKEVRRPQEQLAEIWQRVREAGRRPASTSPSTRSSCAPIR
jgi:predicted DsbA family dithiol-disulfide isomerase